MFRFAVVFGNEVTLKNLFCDYEHWFSTFCKCVFKASFWSSKQRAWRDPGKKSALRAWWIVHLNLFGHSRAMVPHVCKRESQRWTSLCTARTYFKNKYDTNHIGKKSSIETFVCCVTYIFSILTFRSSITGDTIAFYKQSFQRMASESFLSFNKVSKIGMASS